MKQMNLTGKATILVVVLTMCLLGGAVFFAASSETENSVFGKLEEEDMLRRKEIEVRSYLCGFDKVDDTVVMLQNSADGINRVEVLILMKEELSDSERNDLSTAVSQFFDGAGTVEIEVVYANAVK